MFCRKCGVSIPDDSCFCPKCGTRVATQKEESKSFQKTQTPRCIEFCNNGDRTLLRDIVLLIGGLVAAWIGYAMWIGSTIGAYFGTKSTDYYAMFRQDAPNIAQWMVGICGSLVNIAGAICIYVAICPLSQRFSVWRRQNKVIGTILAIVICLVVFVAFALKTSATGGFGIWDYLIMAATFGGMWHGGRQSLLKSSMAESEKNDFSSVDHVERVGGRIDLGSRKANKGGGTNKTLWVVGVPLAVTVIALFYFGMSSSSKNKSHMAGKRRNGYAVKTIEHSNTGKELKSKTKSKTQEGANQSSAMSVAPDYSKWTDEEIDARITELEAKSAQCFLRAFSEGRYNDAAKLIDSIDHDNVEVQFALGVMYERGKGVAKDDGEAVKWYRKAAEQGNANAQYNLAICCFRGNGIERDRKRAAEWLHKAAEQGDADAQNMLGLIYQFGWGVTKDEDTAVNWYRKAAKQGIYHAKERLREMGLSW